MQTRSCNVSRASQRPEPGQTQKLQSKRERERAVRVQQQLGHEMEEEKEGKEPRRSRSEEGELRQQEEEEEKKSTTERNGLDRGRRREGKDEKPRGLPHQRVPQPDDLYNQRLEQL
ncbi:hypothetical protein BHE74_00035881 [Ensete ventricosum]|nr:hypothetical protein BHE74_00035881 [Ensete ventricosum]RZS12833.1 hypothetical protein BHM03_00044337 [Ensete ventricosum]